MTLPRKRRSITTLLTTSYQDIYVAPARFEADVVTIFITNLTSALAQVTLRMYNADDATSFVLLSSVAVPANGILQISDTLYLLVNDKLQGLASANSTFNVTVTVNEENSRKL